MQTLKFRHMAKRRLSGKKDHAIIGVVASGNLEVLLERVLPEDERPSYAALADLNMLVLLPGRERTAKQYGKLFEAAGLRLDRVTETASAIQIIAASAGPS